MFTPRLQPHSDPPDLWEVPRRGFGEASVWMQMRHSTRLLRRFCVYLEGALLWMLRRFIELSTGQLDLRSGCGGRKVEGGFQTQRDKTHKKLSTRSYLKEQQQSHRAVFAGDMGLKKTRSYGF